MTKVEKNNNIKTRINFLKNFFNDVKVASLTPSSGFSVKRIGKKIDFSRRIVIVEFGPGSGVYSKHFLEKMGPDSHLILIETNKDFVDQLRKIQDERLSVFQDSAENVQNILEQCGETYADYVITGLPFSYFAREEKHAIVQNAYNSLRPGGMLLSYQFNYGVKETIEPHFDNIKKDFEPLNLPPLFIFEAYKSSNGEGTAASNNGRSK
ncbi:MAG: methyltransferase [Bacteroidetes bacterium SW_11_45_7]|nr:MAG: methyltransferase [Bacteroidetes bacterium SW_11_45_7]